jgi:hypothetical protein
MRKLICWEAKCFRDIHATYLQGHRSHIYGLRNTCLALLLSKRRFGSIYSTEKKKKKRKGIWKCIVLTKIGLRISPNILAMYFRLCCMTAFNSPTSPEEWNILLPLKQFQHVRKLRESSAPSYSRHKSIASAITFNKYLLSTSYLQGICSNRVIKILNSLMKQMVLPSSPYLCFQKSAIRRFFFLGSQPQEQMIWL